MDLPTYTSIWRIEKRLYKLYDFRLPMPLPIGQLSVFAAIAVPYVVLLTVLGLPFNHTLIWLYILPPGLLTWLATRPVLESKRLPELIKSQARYLAEPRVWCRMAPSSERDVVLVTGRIWRPSRSSRRAEVLAEAAIAAARPAGRGPGRQARVRREQVRQAPAREDRRRVRVPSRSPSAGLYARAADAGYAADTAYAGDPSAASPILQPPSWPVRAAAVAPSSPPGVGQAASARALRARSAGAGQAGPVFSPPARPIRRRPDEPGLTAPGITLPDLPVNPPPAPPALDLPVSEAVVDVPLADPRDDEAEYMEAQYPQAQYPEEQYPEGQEAEFPLEQDPEPPASRRPVVTVYGAGPAQAAPPAVERALAGPSARRGDLRAGRVTVVPGGHRPGKPDQFQRDRARAQLPIGGPRRVIVLGCTVGAGQTVTTLLAGEVLASLRADQVAVLDLNPGAASLQRRATARPALSQAASLGPSRLAVLGPDGISSGEADPPAALVSGDSAGVFELSADEYDLVLADPSTSVVPRLLPLADQLVLVAPASAAAANAITMTFEWLDAHGQAALTAGAIMVLNGVSRRSVAHVEQAERICVGQCRAIVRVPWDDQLNSQGQRRQHPSAGAGQHWAGLLSPGTAAAYTALAGVLVFALAPDAAPDPTPPARYTHQGPARQHGQVRR